MSAPSAPDGSFFLADGRLADPGASGRQARASQALCQWVWAMEMSPEERRLCSAMSPETLAAALTCATYADGGCEPGELGARARRGARAAWLHQLSLSSSASIEAGFMGAARAGAPAGASPLPPLARRLGAGLRWCETLGAPLGGTATLALLACSMAPAAPAAMVLGSGGAAFASLCALAASRLIAQSPWAPERRALRALLKAAYPEQAQAGVFDSNNPPPLFHLGGNGGSAPSEPAQLLKRALTRDDERPLTWVETAMAALRERQALESAAGPAGLAASPRKSARL